MHHFILRVEPRVEEVSTDLIAVQEGIPVSVSESCGASESTDLSTSSQGKPRII